MSMAETMSSAMLSGQVAIPCKVSGVTTAPSRMPITTNATCASGTGIVIGRPSNAATAVASIDPDTKPAGMPIHVKPSPPARAVSKVSQKGSSARSASAEGSIGRSMPGTAPAADELEHGLASMGPNAVLHEIEPLPGAERKRAPGHWDVQRDAGDHGFYVRRHVVGPFGIVHPACISRRQPIE